MRWPGLGVCVDIMAVKKHILVPAIYMTVTDFFPLFSLPFHATLLTALLV